MALEAGRGIEHFAEIADQNGILADRGDSVGKAPCSGEADANGERGGGPELGHQPVER